MELQNKISIISLFSALTIVSFVFENFIPRPAPGIRIGLANIFILIVLISYGYREALTIGIIKSVAGSLIVGQLLSPAFIFSISGTVVSITVMFIADKYLKRLSILGISVLGAESHIITQVWLASRFFTGSGSFIYLLSPYIIISLISGIITGITSFWIYINVREKLNIAKFQT